MDYDEYDYLIDNIGGTNLELSESALKTLCKRVSKRKDTLTTRVETLEGLLKECEVSLLGMPGSADLRERIKAALNDT